MIHEIIKAKYVNLGILPDWPYHLISDEEMVNGFLNEDNGFFYIMYPCQYEDFKVDHDRLVYALQQHLDAYLDDREHYKIPSWVYAYMLGNVIGPNSPQEDRHDLFSLLGTDNLEDEFRYECYKACYKASTTWINKYYYRESDTIEKPPTIFGEAHVIKYLRLQVADALRGDGSIAVS